MFKPGDKVVYVNDRNYLIAPEIIKYNIYTIRYSDNDKNRCRVELEEHKRTYFMNRFISLKEYRKQKLKQLCLSQETK